MPDKNINNRKSARLSCPKPYGTKGWLGFFIGECFYYPFNALVTFFFIWQKSAPQYIESNAILYLTAMFILSYLSLRTGWELRRKKADAVDSAKSFLTITVIWALISAVISNSYGYVNSSMANYYRGNAVLTLVNFVLWRGYFEKSKRVKNTYQNYY